MKRIRQIKDFMPAVPAKKRVAAYARVSVDLEINLHSLRAQVGHYSSLIRSTPGWEYAGIYADEGLSGTGVNRPGFRNLIRECEKGNIDIILTKSISRFARNTVTLLDTVRHLRDLGVSVRFERENIDSLSVNGELLLTLLASFAQAESESISGNTKWGIRKNFEKGMGNQFSPILGYRWDGESFTVVKEEAYIVRLIFRSYLDGMSPTGIAAMLDRKGLRPVKGGTFRYSSVWLILRQTKYTGTSVLQKTFRENHLTHRKMTNRGELPRYVAEGTHPMIIDRETFDAVQEEIARRKALGCLANQSLPFSFFTSKVICGRCGKAYQRKDYSRKGYKPYHKWVCATKKRKGAAACPSCNLPERALYDIVRDVLDCGVPDDRLLEMKVSKVVVSAPFTLDVHLKDGRIERRTWKDEGRNPIVKRRENGCPKHGE